MPKQERVQQTKQKVVTREPEAQAVEAKDKQALKDELDAVLADIDEALQGVDQDLATKYIQKGGE
jgi:uncharacterized FlaG/YvyC family protein